jgi:N-acetylglucosamine-6-phosphate deacetylase
MRLGVKAALVDGQMLSGDVEIEDGIIVEVGLSNPGVQGLAVPGFIDVQINGFAGVDFTDASVEAYQQVAQRLAETGVTSFQPTLISLPVESYLSALDNFRPESVKAGRVLGMHLEGPFIAPARRGAHDAANMINPDVAIAAQLLESGKVTHMTIAPELPGALDLIEFVASRGVTVSLGHTDADEATANAAFDRGASSVTHIFNAQRPFNHRAPALGVTALTRDDVFVTAIVDGIHLADATVRLIGSAAEGRLVLITDAIAAAGQPDGEYALGDRTVMLSNGACRLADGTLAGSALTMDQAVRNLVALGFDFPRAVAAATSAPAALVKRPELGSLSPGNAADVCVLDDNLAVTRTVAFGRETFSR